ncbi:MAG: adenylate/guanylate cyclase domain-containing protein [Thermodesulfobacteriota bacterium]|nr:adenylate/guanylate cyclase domain-containing protein [Thermodesulfobacteriota bacterium]
MRMFRIRSMQQRLVIFLLLPLILLLFGAGFLGFLYARIIMLEQWEEAAFLKLQRAAHDIDMRLNRSFQLVEIINASGGLNNDAVNQKFLFDQLESLEGVTKVSLEWFVPPTDKGMMSGMYKGHRMMQLHHSVISKIAPPTYDSEAGGETVSLISSLTDDAGKVIGKLDVAVRFDYLMADVFKLGWWQSDMAGLVDQTGKYVVQTETMVKGIQKLGETGSPLEELVTEAIRQKTSGTIRGPGHPPVMVAGFYSLEKAPWNILLFAPGEEILKPIIRLRNYFLMGSLILVMIILVLIRANVGKMVDSIQQLSRAAKGVAQGDYGQPVLKESEDEIGQLIDSYNAMVEGLKERDFIRNTFGRYMDKEFAQRLLRHPEMADLGGQKREGVILMSDLRGFTPLAETLNPEMIIHILNHYFSYMIRAIKQHRGIVVDLVGDMVLVFFDPLDGPIQSAAINAVRCAFDMQDEMKKFNNEIKQEKLADIEMGIGINAGHVVVGNIGSETRAKYSIIGSAVNITHRIQSVAKPREILISDSVYNYVKEDVTIKRSFKSHLKGVKDMLKLYAIGTL